MTIVRTADELAAALGCDTAVIPPEIADVLGPPAVTARAQVTEVAIEFNADGGTTVTISAVEVEAA